MRESLNYFLNYSLELRRASRITSILSENLGLSRNFLLLKVYAIILHILFILGIFLKHIIFFKTSVTVLFPDFYRLPGTFNTFLCFIMHPAVGSELARPGGGHGIFFNNS